jgi:hypothetical protein
MEVKMDRAPEFMMLCVVTVSALRMGGATEESNVLTGKMNTGVRLLLSAIN